MKYISTIQLTCFCLFLSGCASKSEKIESVVRENAEAFIKPMMNDADSFEFVSLEMIDTITFEDNIDKEIRSYRSELILDSGRLADYDFYKTNLTAMFDSTRYLDLKISVEKLESIINQLETLKDSLGTNRSTPAAFLWLYSFRGTNSFGALVVNQYYMQTGGGPEYEVLKVSADLGGLLAYPGGYPGYNKLKE